MKKHTFKAALALAIAATFVAMPLSASATTYGYYTKNCTGLRTLNIRADFANHINGSGNEIQAERGGVWKTGTYGAGLKFLVTGWPGATYIIYAFTTADDIAGLCEL